MLTFSQKSLIPRFCKLKLTMRFHFWGQKWLWATLIFDQSAIGKISKLLYKIVINESSKNFLCNGCLYLFLILTFPLNAKNRTAQNHGIAFSTICGHLRPIVTNTVSTKSLHISNYWFRIIRFLSTSISGATPHGHFRL
jgi:hypothetical protein